ncbi:MAG: dipicolinate synthase subunit B [Bacillota bacterium]|nr:dipicolinate synthase subunit B [Bacillota bacterium]
MTLENKTIGFALTGSFCMLQQVLPQIEALVQAGAVVIPIISDNVRDLDTRFFAKEDLRFQIAKITGQPIIQTINQAEPIGPKQMLDVLIIAPCTGNTLAKLANAITDTPVLMAAKSQLRNGRPVVIAVSTNDGLGNNARNLGALLNAKNIYFVPFGQNDSQKKCNSLVAKMDMIQQTLQYALEGRQIQPLLLGILELKF